MTIFLTMFLARDIDEIIDIVGTGVDELEAVLEEFPSSDEVNQTVFPFFFFWCLSNPTVLWKGTNPPPFLFYV